MPRIPAAVLAALLFAPALPAADPAGAGTYKFRFTADNEPITLLLRVTPDQKGEFLGAYPALQEAPKVASVALKDGELRFRVTFAGREFLNFEGKYDAERGRVRGAYTQFGRGLRPTDLLPSELKKLDDPIDLLREEIKQRTFGPELFDAGFEFMALAGAKKLPAAEVREAAEKLAKAASGYGTRYERTIALRIAGLLLEQPGYADAALAQARRAERLLDDDAPPLVALEVAETLVKALAASGKTADAAKASAALARLEARDYAEYMKGGLTDAPAYPGRKGASKRTALVEVFTGADCPPCVAVDLAGTALMKAFKPADAIFLAYHFHVPTPDPLTGPDGMERVGYYKDVIRGAPMVLVNGKPGPEGGGPASAAAAVFNRMTDALAAELEKPSPVSITLKIDGGKATASVTGVDPAAGKPRLRFVLAEERVRYAGGSGVRYHHHVVRGMPGGAAGFPLTKAATEQVVDVDAEAVRKKLAAYLDEFAKTDGPFPRPDRPLELKGLKLVALVQDDATQEVLAATVADVGK